MKYAWLSFTFANFTLTTSNLHNIYIYLHNLLASVLPSFFSQTWNSLCLDMNQLKIINTTLVEIFHHFFHATPFIPGNGLSLHPTHQEIFFSLRQEKLILKSKCQFSDLTPTHLRRIETILL